MTSDYGSPPGQLGAMPAGDFDAAIASPPYGDAISNDGGRNGSGIDWEKSGRLDRTKPSNNRHNPMTANMMSYGRTPGNLGNMAMDGAISSPPFESVYPGSQAASKFQMRPDGKPFGAGASMLEDSYGTDLANIGNDTGASFWAAARVIVEQVYSVLKPGGYSAWVCGDFVRNRKRVYFGQQWLDLCTAVGFVPVEWVTCWKSEYKGTQIDIFGNDHHRQVDRVSFFRRLANEKNPDAAILNEDVIIVRKPLA